MTAPDKLARKMAESLKERWEIGRVGSSWEEAPVGKVAETLRPHIAALVEENAKLREELVQVSMILPSAGGVGGTVLQQARAAVAAAERKAKEWEAEWERGDMERLGAERRAEEAEAKLTLLQASLAEVEALLLSHEGHISGLEARTKSLATRGFVWLTGDPDEEEEREPRTIEQSWQVIEDCIRLGCEANDRRREVEAKLAAVIEERDKLKTAVEAHLQHIKVLTEKAK